MEIVFWICWTAGLIVVLWWIITDAQQKRMASNPYSFVCLIYLVVVLVVRLGMNAKGISNKMIMVTAIPLLGLLLIIVIAMVSGKKWN